MVRALPCWKSTDALNALKRALQIAPFAYSTSASRSLQYSLYSLYRGGADNVFDSSVWVHSAGWIRTCAESGLRRAIWKRISTNYRNVRWPYHTQYTC